MSNKRRGLLVIFIFVISTLLISACTQSLSSAPDATPTFIPTGLFVSPFPSVENPMAMIEEFAKQTAAAQTSAAGGGTPGTPGTPQAITTTGTIITAQPGDIPTVTPTVEAPSTPTNAAITLTSVVASGPTNAAIPPGTRPLEYVLQEGEWPYCIARRFDVDPDALLQASNLTSPAIYYTGLRLTIPQSGAFPGPRVLAAHPTNYTVLASDTINTVACKFGDVYPDAIASANGISVSAKLTAGQALKIP